MQRQEGKHKPDILTTSTSPILERQIAEITAGLPNTHSRNLRLLSEDNIKTIIRYVNAVKIEVNSATNYRRDIIEAITRFAVHDSMKIEGKKFKDATRDDIISFLNSFRKPESVDPLHKWIGTYNTYQVHLVRFFKWLYQPDIEPDKRTKPLVVTNVPKLKRKETSIYRPADLWTVEDDLLFLKYCPTKRDKCYHAISRDLAARPQEILKLKIRDISFKIVPSGRQYVEVVVNGKTGTRPLPLINSIPYLKDYLDHGHPFPSNLNAPLICGEGKSLGLVIAFKTSCFCDRIDMLVSSDTIPNFLFLCFIFLFISSLHSFSAGVALRCIPQHSQNILLVIK